MVLEKNKHRVVSTQESYPNLAELDRRLATMQKEKKLVGVSFCSASGLPADKAERERIAGAICAMLELSDIGLMPKVSSSKF